MASSPGYVHSIRNREIVAIAKAAGSPSDKGAGLYLYKKKGQRVDANEKLVTIYAESEAKLKRAKEFILSNNPFEIEGMLIKRVTDLKPR